MRVLQHVVYFKLNKMTAQEYAAIQAAGSECAKLKGIISYTLGEAEVSPYQVMFAIFFCNFVSSFFFVMYLVL